MLNVLFSEEQTDSVVRI